jgi:outer membrane protein assembly factor BamD
MEKGLVMSSQTVARIVFLARLLAPIALIGGLAATQLGCSGKSVEENDPSALLKEAEEDVKSDHYQIAIEKLRSIKNKFPYSNYATEAQLRIADVYFLQESYGEAAVAYEAFRDLHPKHEKVPYAMFRTGKAYFNDIPGTIARDMTPANKALEAYSEFLKRFPNAPESADARKDLAEIRRLLAEKELYIANFYFKRDFYDSAKPRYKKILDTYPETAAANEAREKLARIEKTDGKPQ